MNADKTHILLVEDDAAMGEMLAEFLLGQGHHASCFRAATRALEHLAGVDLIISDINMPQMTGLEFLAEVKLYHPQIPVILITSFATGNLAQLARDAGAALLLPKPFKLADLRDAIEGSLPWKKAQ